MTLAEDVEPAEWLSSTTRAFDEVYRTHIRVVYAYARARVGTSEAEDVVSDVFHAAALAFRTGRSDMVTGAWLMAVTRNKVIDRWRRAERRMAKSHLLQRSNHVEMPVDWRDDDRREAVLATLERMKHRHRALLVMHHVDGMPTAEIAQLVGESTAAIESALARARDAFRREYAKLEPIEGEM